ncbi:MvdD family ATP-grasp ribosomal peptide maturase [bacterium]|nr:MvdD family ATP-grasp ribosomal peptide maturase [bacterium]
MAVLILTHSQDNQSIALVSQALTKRGATPVRLDSDLYPQALQVSTHLSGQGRHRHLNIDGQKIDLQTVTACWYRRFAAASLLPQDLGDTREACVAESRQTLYGTIAALDCFQLDPLRCVRRADHKEVQLEKALDFGLSIPATLISNDPEEALAFYRDNAGLVVTKTQTSFAIYRDQEEHVVFTSQVREEHLHELDGLACAPMMFQQMLPKRLELRATVVGGRVFTAAVDSQKLPGATVDWRREGVALVDAWTPYQLPPEVENGLLQLTSHFGLNYGAADFIVTPEGQHIFLEVNAGGEWFWLQPIWPIAEAIADLLIDPFCKNFR